MFEYFLINGILSLLSLIALTTLNNAPARLKFFVCIAALFFWLIPWQLISFDWVFPEPAVLRTTVFWESVRPLSNVLAQPQNDWVFHWEWLFISALMFGLILFAFQILKQRHLLKQWHEKSKVNQSLWPRFGFATEKTPLRVVADYDNAFVSGYFNPVIWVGERQLKNETTRSILQHELVHIKHHDNFYLFYILLIKSLFWWNPLVRLLVSQARVYIELSCDDACRRSMPDYQEYLARALLQKHQKNNQPVLCTPFFLREKFNLYRIKQLSKEFKVTSKHIFSITLLTLLGLLTVAIPATSKQILSDAATITRLEIITAITDGDSKHERSMGGEFRGAESEVQKLYALASELSVDVSTNIDEENIRHIQVNSNSLVDTKKLLAVFNDSPLKIFFREENKTGSANSSQRLLIDLNFRRDQEKAVSLTLAATDSHWTGIEEGDYLFRIRPSVVNLQGREAVSIVSEISEKVDGAYQVVATPHVVTALNEDATIEIGEKNEKGLYKGLSMTLNTKRVD
ncbi:M56 family metallopeptidase [Aliikangiella coralliicola]|uniref:M56 family metallopeptidase n=1 Tax=Aliikangiella coralliicola TaxID=2592383 RepID=A0A545UJF6_9GAMM|nr:M56 family metallopeptidase [Aliikangiella coralliicola]TQV89597.1 M56 family metallopeptidase [Aliikangiella coralliicola]